MTTMTLFCRLFYNLEYIFRLVLRVYIVDCFAQVCWENKDFGYFNFCLDKHYSVFSETRQSLPRLSVEHWDVMIMFFIAERKMNSAIVKFNSKLSLYDNVELYNLF